ncbi:MAG TPA: gliding motility-associated C-terminal domain-containing protein [Bacteroidales bacterium]|nr:gliding motility-associated C-terminal domain-containing protein [Bacteroidales bacterium]
MTKLIKLFIIFGVFIGSIFFVKAQVPPGIVPYEGIPILVPATTAELSGFNYLRLTTGAWIPRDTTQCIPIPIPNGHNTISNTGGNPALSIFSSSAPDLNTCWLYDNSIRLQTFPMAVDFVGWDTVSYGIPRVLRMGNTTPLEGSLSSNIGMTSSYYFKPTQDQNLLVFSFAFVATNPITGTHRKWRNPLFRVELTDEFGNFVTSDPMHSTFYILPKGLDFFPHPCAHDLGFQQRTCYSTFSEGVFWSEWIKVAFDLSDFMGQVVRLRILVSECSANFHRAYCYYTGFGTKAALDIQACGDDNLTLEAPVGFSSYRWFINDVEDFDLVDIRKFTRARNTSETTFRCDMISRTGAPSSISATVNYYDLFPNFSWEQKFDECENKVQFTNLSEIYKINNGGNVSQPIQYVRWDFGDNITSSEINPVHFYNGLGPYQVNLKIWDADSICNVDTTMEITLMESVPMTAQDTVSTCEEKLPYLYVDPLMSPTDVYSWTVPGNYTVTYPQAAWNGCDSIVSVNLEIKKPQVRIEQHQDYCESFSAELVAIPNPSDVEYLWSTEETTSSIIITKHGTYGVTITDENDCTANSFIKIAACEPPIYIPSAITPSDKNGLNDCIELHAANLIQSIDLTIYDRYGAAVYKTFDKNFKWCGEVFGQTPVNMIYQYVLIIVDQRGIETMKKGTITVL